MSSNYNFSIFICNVKFIKPVQCVDANHETVVALEFLNKINFEICQKIDKSIKKGCIPCSCAVKFDKGKTCLFKVDDAVLRKESTEIPLNIEVYQKLQCSCYPSKLVVGKATTDLRPAIVAAFGDEAMKTYKKTLELRNESDSEISALLELSYIMTKTDDVIINDFVVSEDGKLMTCQDDVNASDSNKRKLMELEKTLGELNKIANMKVDEKTTSFQGVPIHGETCPCSKIYSTKDSFKQMIDDTIMEKQPTESQEAINTKEYFCEEISAVMNGNAVKIRIPRKRTSQTADVQPKVSGTPKEYLHGDKPERTMVFGENEIIMSMRQKGQEEEANEGFHTSYTAGDPNAGKPVVNITPTSIPGSVQALKVIDPEKDVFLLKINKKCHTKDNASLELELATPKPLPKPAKPFSETRSSQYDPNDCPPPTPPPEPEPEPEPAPPPPPPKKGGKGGKGGKGKGKGKGKKK